MTAPGLRAVSRHGPSPFLLPPYATRRMAVRQISLDEVRRVLGDPTVVGASADADPRVICRRTVDGRRLAVVVEGLPGDPVWVMVTAWEEG